MSEDLFSPSNLPIADSTVIYSKELVRNWHHSISLEKELKYPKAEWYFLMKKVT